MKGRGKSARHGGTNILETAEMPASALHGRGASGNTSNRFEKLHVELEPVEADPGGDEPVAPKTQFYRDNTRTIIARNDSPDVGFERSVNPYRGCEHGCIYCFARPTHEYLGFSAGLDFETQNHGESGRTGVARSRTLLTEMEAAGRCHERGDRSVSAGRTPPEVDPALPRSAREISQPSRDHHEESARHARHRYSRRAGVARRGQPQHFGHFARREFAADPRAAHLDRHRHGWTRSPNCPRPAFRSA